MNGELPPRSVATVREAVAQAMQQYFADLEGDDPGELYTMVLNEIEEPLLKATLEHTRNNQSRAAAILGINRGTLRKKLRAHGLE